MSSMWLELREGAPGLGGVYLQEHKAPYRYLDDLGEQCCQFVLAIGGRAKRAALLRSNYEQTGAISLSTLGDRSPGLLLVDCELHLRRGLLRTPGGPCPGHYKIHSLQPMPIDSIIYKIYWELLLPFSTIVFLFVDDLGLQATIDLLISYLQQASVSSASPKVRFIVVSQTYKHLDLRTI